MRLFWGGHFEFLSRPFWIFFLLHFNEKCSPFLWGIIFLCTMDGFSRILEKKLSKVLCTRLYVCTYKSHIIYLYTYWDLWSIVEYLYFISAAFTAFLSNMSTLILHWFLFWKLIWPLKVKDQNNCMIKTE